jgi:hypothetical protein
VPVPAGGSGSAPDQLATLDDLAAKMQCSVSELDEASALLAIEGATAVVQATARQRLVRVDDDAITLSGGYGPWLRLPERPVISISSAALDGTVLSLGTAEGTYRLRGARIWRSCGWQTPCYGPSEVQIVYSHGYDLDDQDVQLARTITASLAAGAYEQPGGGAVQREQIDDYSVAYAAAAAQMEATPSLRSALRHKYGLKASMVAI